MPSLFQHRAFLSSRSPHIAYPEVVIDVRRTSSGGDVTGPPLLPKLPRQTTAPSALTPHVCPFPAMTSTNFGIGVGVAVGVLIGVGVGTGVAVGVGVGVKVNVGVGVMVGAGVFVGVGVMVGAGVFVGVGVMVGVGVVVGVGVIVGVIVAIGVAVGVPRLATPRALSVGRFSSSSLTETANPMLATGLPPDVSSILDVLTPITSPELLTNGPPLLPGLIAASV